METVEMDLMQAQIGSLATDVSRLEAKVAKGESLEPLVVTFTDITPVTTTKFTATASMTGDEILDAILAGKNVNAVIDGRLMGMGVIQIPFYGTDNAATERVWGMSVIAWTDTTITRMAYLKVIIGSNDAVLELYAS